MTYNPYDLDDSGVVNTIDQSIFRDNYGVNYGRDAVGLAKGAFDFAAFID
jgi:hypothetical protein